MLPEPSPDGCHCLTFVPYPCEFASLLPPDHLAACVVADRPFQTRREFHSRRSSPEILREKTILEPKFIKAFPGKAARPQSPRFLNHAGGKPCTEPLPDALPYLLRRPLHPEPEDVVGMRSSEPWNAAERFCDLDRPNQATRVFRFDGFRADRV